MRCIRLARPAKARTRSHSSSLRLEFLEDRTLLSVADFVQPGYVLMHTNGQVGPLARSSPTGYSPSQVRHAYGFDQINFGGVPGDSAGTTIANVDAYHE